MGGLKNLPEPEEVPVEARASARGLKRWLQERRERDVPANGTQPDNHPGCEKSCELHDHSK